MRSGIVVCLAICLIGCVELYGWLLEGRLLRADPASLPGNMELAAFARSPGRALYEFHCAACHGMQGRADTRRGVPDLTDQDWLYGDGSVADIEKIIEYGIRSRHPKAWDLAIMPAYGKPIPSSRDPAIPSLAPAEIRDIVDFLLYQEGRSANAAAAARGAAIYGGRGGCYDCHGSDAKGDAAIGAPNLSDAVTLYGDGSQQALAVSVVYGRQGICPAFIKRIKPAGIREIALYVHSLSNPTRPIHVTE